jgi:hypothetical protein
MLGGVVYLLYRGYPLQTWVLAGCVGFIALAVLTLLRAVTAREPNIPDLYRQEFDRESHLSIMGFDLPFYGGYEGDYLIEYDPQRTHYLVAAGYDLRTPITVAFAPVQTAGGQWAFVEGALRVSGEVNGTFVADPQQNWIGANEAQFEQNRALFAVQPQITVLIPLLNRSSEIPLQAAAEVTIRYPVPDGPAQEQTLRRDFTLSVIGGDYYAYYNRYSNWKRTRSVIDSPVWIGLVAGSVIAAGVGVVLVRRGDLGPRAVGGASGLMLVIRRLSGSQKLGLELHRLDKVRQITSVSQGVYIGRVIAQSPAGRAGFRTGDVLIALGGKPVNGPGAVNRIARGYQKGAVIEAVVLRDGESVRLAVRF